MVRKSMWAALAVLLAYTPGALAYEYMVDQTATLTYATELFGEGSATGRVSYDGNPPVVTLWVVLTDAEENGIGDNDEMTITLSVSGGTFATQFRASDVGSRVYSANNIGDVEDPRDGHDPGNIHSDYEVNVTRDDGGAAGDSSVVFKAEAISGWASDDGNSAGAVLRIEVEMPGLRGLNGRTPVTATFEVEAGGGSGFRSSANAMNHATAPVTIAANTARSESGVLRRAEDAVNNQRASVPIINFDSALTFANTTVGVWPFPPGTARINLAGGRTSFQPHGVLPYAFLARPVVGVPSADVLQWDGEAFSIANRESGAGDLVVGVTGEFRSGDTVFLDLNGNWQAENNERLTLRDGVMSGRFGLIDIAGIPTDSDMRMQTEGVAGRWLLFRPNGTDTLRPADYRTTLSVDFTVGSNRDKVGGTSISADLATSYTTIDPSATRQAYAIPPVGSTDLGNIRVKCEVAVGCPLYLECDDGAGDSWFRALEEPVAGRATMRLNSAMLAEQLGISEDGWEGRLSCNVMSTQTISVQVLTRSGDVLVNNTYIDG